MALVADRVKETTATTGTGTITLAGASTGYRTFSSAFSTGSKVYYALVSGSAWETGVGTYTTSGNTLSRDSIISSSNSGSAITLTGTSDVFVTAPAKLVEEDFASKFLLMGA
jgi:hypothetical protein